MSYYKTAIAIIPGSKKTLPLVEHAAGNTVLMCFQFCRGTWRQIAGRVHHTLDGGRHAATKSSKTRDDMLKRPPTILGSQSRRHHTRSQRIHQSHWTKLDAIADRNRLRCRRNGCLLHWQNIYNSFSQCFTDYSTWHSSVTKPARSISSEPVMFGYSLRAKWTKSEASVSLRQQPL